MTKQREFVVLKIPVEHWETLSETLSVDSTSKAFDKDLRKKIKAGLDAVEVLGTMNGQTHYQLLHVSGCVEPSLVGPKAGSWEELEKGVKKFVAGPDYDRSEDGLFFVKLNGIGQLMDVCPFSGGFMDKILAKVGK